MVKSLLSISLFSLGILLVCGCRSTVSTSAAGVNRVPYGVNRPSYTRPYGGSQQIYDDNSLMPSDAPQSDPSSIPPVPAAKKSRWNLVPSGLKFPSMSRSNSEISQTGVKSDRTSAKKYAKSSGAAKTSRLQSDEFEEQTVTSRHSDFSNRRSATPSLPSDAMDSPIIPPPTFTESNREVISPRPSVAPQYGANRRTASTYQGFKTPALDSSVRPLPKQVEPSTINSGDDLPLLLPPGN